MKKYTEDHMNMLEKVKINCTDVEDVFFEFIENELPLTLSSRIDSHINRCSDCKSFSSEYSLVVELASELKLPEMTSSTKSRIHQSLNEQLGINLPV